MCSMIRISLGAFWMTKDANFLHGDNGDSDQSVDAQACLI